MLKDWHSLYGKKLTLVKIIIAAFCFSANQAAAQEYIVKLKNSPDKYDLNSLRISSDSVYQITDRVDNLNMVKVFADINHIDEDPTEILQRYFDAEYVVLNIKLQAFMEMNDPRRSEQWALDMVKAKEAWDISLGSHAVIVAVIDTGIAMNHEDLGDNIWINVDEVPSNGLDDDNNGFIDDVNGWDFNGNDKDPSDETGAQNPGHGTHCAGIIGAVCGNERGVCGISPQVSLMVLRFLDKNGSGDLFASVKAIDYAMSNGAHVISASWGATVPQQTAQPIIDAIKRAEEKGVIFVAAAANDGKSNDTTSVYPANAQTPHMISVAASNNKDEKPRWSNYGRKVDLAAPGENILSTIPGSYQTLSGTSMATPLVAGTVALMKSLDISLTGAVARSILQSTGNPVNIETASNRRIDARKALEAVQQKQLTLVPAALTLAANAEYNFSAWGGTPPYRFASLNPDIATVDEAGHLKALKEGDVGVEVSDINGNKANSVSIRIANAPQGGEGCPYPDPFLCLISCAINPALPWCSGNNELPPLPDFPGIPGLPELPEWPGLPKPH